MGGPGAATNSLTDGTGSSWTYMPRIDRLRPADHRPWWAVEPDRADHRPWWAAEPDRGERHRTHLAVRA
ncbi:hypothetical protein ACIPC1_04720 [Streptomyces sp. NPDC087263]|uniref:hypothetical protein n=1 Tax=Streptomyces sp. NPDC087263 TaxID=3365773 RepID=UPI003811FF32